MREKTAGGFEEIKESADAIWEDQSGSPANAGLPDIYRYFARILHNEYKGNPENQYPRGYEYLDVSDSVQMVT
ncbi:hypothetical protein Y032_0017g3281 [Ancylostoma ceylanicum]|uniref:Uncharacterized protein n=1 Tax=Ancylostoma ceylanicum TaxID=53326 RepID=A0A016V4X5_9BILA|nr:hypothetical protein Y032_0017g3281 [Ancylostoma ceylanicum]